MAAAKRNKPGPVLVVVLILLVIISIGVFKAFGPTTSTHTHGDYLYIHTGSNYEQVKEALEKGGFVSDMWIFDLMAKRAHLPERILPGRYKIPPLLSNYRIVKLLHSGKQAPVKLVINRLRTQRDFIRLLATNLEPDSATLYQQLHDPAYLSQFGLDTNTLIAAVMPNTYEFLWNTTADNAFRKIAKSYTKFWNSTRTEQAQNHGLTPIQATIVASIVDEETNITDDKPKIASVYLNRLRTGMKLQADPTVKFAIGDFAIRRVTGPMLETRSPYNTYMYAGLPPGPICTPSPGSLNAVLTSPKTTYLYFCAKEDFSGYSNFASTYNEQLKNAAKYRKALDARGIH